MSNRLLQQLRMSCCLFILKKPKTVSGQNAANTYERKIRICCFEEGRKFTIPELEFKVGDKILKTIPYEIDVINTAQKADQINDIMNNKQVKLEPKRLLELYKFYILSALAVLH